MDLEREASVIRAAQAGELWAQDKLVAAYLPLVYNIVGRALNGHADVDDVVQETMIGALRGLGGLRDPGSFRSWLVAIAMNRIRSHWQASQHAFDSGGDVRDAHDVADPGADFADLTILRLGLSGQRREVAEATRWLDADDRSLLSLWWLEAAGELTRAEVAAAMELSTQHTAVRVQRMKAQLETARLVVRALSAVPRCVLLDDVLGAWDGAPSALWRKRIARHTRDCTVCSGYESGLVPAEGLLVGLGLLPVSAALSAWAGMRAQNVGAVPAAHDTLATPADAGGHFGPGGQGGQGGQLGDAAPVGDAAGHTAQIPLVPRPRTERRRKQARQSRQRRVAVVGGVTLLLGGGGVVALSTLSPGEGGDTVVTQSGAAPEASLPAAPLTASPSASTASPSPSASASASPSPKPSPSTSPSKKASPTPKPTPSRTVVRTVPRQAPATPRPPATGSSFAQRVTELVNAERAKSGCGPVRQNSRLDTAAQRHSADMDARDFFDHTNPDGEGPGERVTAAGYEWSTYGENIARGQQTPDQVMDAWMNSSGHRANILNCSFKEIGIGIHEQAGGPWWTQVFGAQR
ncbi:sigma-70 family RNA polymerase sigma factor [Streptomyces sp. NRRL S-118]|uniref:sigma-70 family RNA polymerase sigma factor n=1 Tax=Streptomyces sp. NRRL S-118 TaxID=1463881 RepID=UPI000D146DD0